MKNFYLLAFYGCLRGIMGLKTEIFCFHYIFYSLVFQSCTAI